VNNTGVRDCRVDLPLQKKHQRLVRIGSLNRRFRQPGEYQEVQIHPRFALTSRQTRPDIA
jgi:hypothetical protein